MSKPKLALIPSGYKSGKVYSILPNDATGDFDFDRASEGTRVRKDGLIEEVADNVPRLDWYNSNCPSLLLERQSTNLITYSQDFSQWNNNGGTLTPNVAVSPSGENNAYKYNTDGSYRILRNLVTLNTSTNYTFTFYAKNIDAANAYYRVYNNTNTSDVISVTNYISQINTSTWTRIEVNFTTDASGTEYAVYLMSGNSDGDILFWGAQVEALSYATSYIPTNGSTVTRLADVCNNSGNSDLINSTEGVLYAEISALANDGTNRILGMSNGGDFNNSVLLRFSSASNKIQAQVRLGGVYQCSLNYDVTDATEFNKIAFKYKQNDFSLFVNGVERATDTSGNVITGLDVLDFDISTTNEFYGNVKCVAVFKEALSDTELEKLTTI